MAFRFLSLVTGISLLLAATALARQVLSPRAGLIFLALMAVSQPLVYYSNEFKPYELDALIAVLLTLGMLWVYRREKKTSAILIWGAGSAVAAWFSYPSLFLFGALMMPLLWDSLSKRNAPLLMITAATGFGVLASFVFRYFALDRISVHSDLFQNFWVDWMMPRNSLLAAIAWMGWVFWKACEFPLGIKTAVPLMIAFVAGVWALWQAKRRTLLTMLLGPTLLAFVAAVMHRYPFGLRLLCFTIPATLLFAAVGVDWLWQTLPKRICLIAPVLLLLLLAVSSLKALASVIHPTTVQELKPVLAYIRNHQGSDNALWICETTEPGFVYYAERYGLHGRFIRVRTTPSLPTVLNDISTLRGRVWIVRAIGGVKIGSEDQQVIDAMNKAGRKVDSISTPGVDAFAFEFADH